MTMKLSTLAAALALCAAGAASAHTISIGVYNAGGPGSVTLAMGTYDHGPNIFQGSMSLTGPVNVGPVAFSSVVSTKPVGLIDGVNNFYADATPATFGTLAADSFHQATNTVGLGPVVEWQELTFAGLTAGTYTYTLTGMSSANWNNVNSFDNNWSGTLVIREADVNGTPEPASLALVGLSLAGLAAARRRRAKA